VVGNMGGELPKLTVTLITVGEFLRDHGTLVVPLALGAILLVLYLLFGFSRTKFIGDSVILATPGMGKLLRQVEIARLGNVLGRLFQSGVPVTDALNLLQNLTSLRPYRTFYAYLATNIEAGNSFRDSFMKYKRVGKLIPLSFQRLIFSAEQSGTLANSLVKVGEVYEEKVDITSRNIAAMLEPILLVIVWIGVAAISIGIILPIYSTIGSFTSGEANGASGAAEVGNGN